jgi:hypothetical protein
MRARLLTVVFCLVFCSVPASWAGDPPDFTVMTRNQYLGGDVFAVAAAPDFEAFLAAVRATLLQVAANDFRERAQALAREIAGKRPEIVGLQEVYDFRLNFQNGSPPFVDHLAQTLAALDALGTPYVAVASVENLNVTVPADLDGDGAVDSQVTVVDRDVILAREDVAGAVTPVPLSQVCGKPSADGGPGCNYVEAAAIPEGLPLAGLEFKRGYVAVDADWGGRTYRVVNTHLEVRNLDPGNPLTAFFQAAQATELQTILALTTPPDRTLVVVGDINSSPVHEPVPLPGGGSLVPPYRQFTSGVDLLGRPIAGAGLADAWPLRPGRPPGWTCCQMADLLNPSSVLDERIDVVFSRGVPGRVKANVVGNDPADRTPSGLWPSDHAGVVARLWF